MLVSYKAKYSCILYVFLRVINLFEIITHWPCTLDNCIQMSVPCSIWFVYIMQELQIGHFEHEFDLLYTVSLYHNVKLSYVVTVDITFCRYNIWKTTLCEIY